MHSRHKTNHHGISGTVLQIFSAASAAPAKKGSTNSGLVLMRLFVFMTIFCQAQQPLCLCASLQKLVPYFQ